MRNELHEAFLYATPLVPVILQSWLIFRYRSQMKDVLPEPANDREGHRTFLITFAGFSFTGLLGLVALSSDISQRVMPIWFCLLSFLSFLAAYNLQAYKSHRWHDHIGNMLADISTLCLVLSIVSLVIAHDGLSVQFKCLVAVASAFVWSVDFVIRFCIIKNFLSDRSQGR